MLENKVEVSKKSLNDWMIDANYSDDELGLEISVSRQTVWRWRHKKVMPNHRARKVIQEIAGDDVVLIFGDS